MLAGTALPVSRTAQTVRAGIASAVDGADVMGYCSCVLPEAREGRISVTVVGGLGCKRTLTYLIGSCTLDDAAATLYPDHDIHVISDVVDEQYVADHVRAWLTAA